MARAMRFASVCNGGSDMRKTCRDGGGVGAARTW
jgi:hypothetical protein